MSISAPRYAGGEIRRRGRAGRAGAIFVQTVRTQAGWGTWGIVAVSYLAIVLIVVLDAEVAAVLGGVRLATFHAPYASQIWPYLILIVATAVGSGCIADDLGSRSITLYLSRPIHLVDYLAAKSAAVAFWVGVAAIGPGVVGVVISAGLGLASGPVAFDALVAFGAVGGLTTVFFTALAVALSTLTSRGLYAGVGIFGVTLSTDLAANAIHGATGNSGILYLSPINDVLTGSESAFATGAVTDTVPGTGVALLVAAAVILLIVAWLRLDRVEVVGE